MSRLGPQRYRYELRVFSRGKRGALTRVRTATQWSNDPHDMAMAIWRHKHQPEPSDLVYNVVDHSTGTRLGVVLTYEQLVRRAGSSVASGS